MILTFDISGQQLEHLPPRPVASATFEVVNLDKRVGEAGRLLVSGVAEVDTTEHLLDEPAGWLQSSSTRISLTTTGAITPGDQAWIEDPSGAGELLEVDGVVSDDYARARLQLVNNYPAGSVLRRLPITTPDGVLDPLVSNAELLEAPLRVTWRYGQTAAQQLVRIVRASGGEGQLAGAIRFARRYMPQLNEQAREGDREIEGWAEIAKGLVEADLRHLGDGIEPTRLLVGERADQLIGTKLLIIAAANGVRPKDQAADVYLDHVRKMFTRMWEQLTVGTPGLGVETDVRDDATASPTRAGLRFGL